MGWGQTGRILLVWPERGRVLTRQLDLVLLERHSQALGAQLAFVTRDPDVRFHARQLGIPVFKSLRQAQNSHWRIPRSQRREKIRRQMELSTALQQPGGDSEVEAPATRLPERPPQPGQPSPLTRQIFFTLGVLALLSVAAVLLPSAEIRLAPQARQQEITFSVQVDPDLDEMSISGAVPARRRAVVVEGRDHLPVSGSILIPDHPASGWVRFSNLTDQLVKIPTGTIVLSPLEESLRFRTTLSGNLAAGVGETLLLPVQALEPGKLGNLPPDSLTAIEGSLGTSASVTNPGAISGGTERKTQAPSENDRRELRNRLYEALRQTALEELRSELAPNDILLSGSLVLSDTLQESYEPAQIQPADEISLDLRLEFAATLASGDDLRNLAVAILDANLPAGFSAQQGTLEIENLGVPRAVRQAWEMRASRQLQAQVPETQAVRLAIGVTPQQAEERLKVSLPLENRPQIILTPPWWPRLPVLPFRIRVVDSS